MSINPESINGLDKDAWERWVAYRISIKRPLKEASLHAAAIKLSKFGDDQAEIVEQSVANQWQGLFPLHKSKPAPGEKPQKTDKQKAADEAVFMANRERAEKGWNETLKEPDPLAKLRLCDALLARYTVNFDPSTHDDKMEWLKEVVGAELRRADMAKVIGDPHIMSMIRQLYGERAVMRAKERAQ